MLIFALVFGAVIGSFCNMLIARLPAGKSIFWPPSSCMKCGQKLRIWHNIPLISYLLLRGRCGHCGERYGAGYLLTEIACALIFFLSFYLLGFDWQPAADFEALGIYALIDALVFSLCGCFIYALCIMDLRHFAVPELLLQITLLLAIFVGASNLAFAVVIGAAAVFKAAAEGALNLLRPEFYEREESEQIWQLDCERPWFFLALLAIFIADASVFGGMIALMHVGMIYVACNVFCAIVNKFLMHFKCPRRIKAGRARVYKEIFGAADIEMLGIICIFSNSYSATAVALFLAALLMLFLHLLCRFCRLNLRPNAPDDLPANALPFFPFLALGLILVLVFPELNELIALDDLIGELLD